MVQAGARFTAPFVCRLLSGLAVPATLALALAVSGPVATADPAARPQRIVSTNLCADQILVRLVEPERIVSLSHLAWKDESLGQVFAPILKRARPNHGLAEEVIMMDPDLVVSGTFSARFSNELMMRLGKNLALFAPENSFAEWYDNIRKLGAAVGEPARAEALIADFQSRLAKLRADIPPGEMPIYASLTPNNWMPGKDTFYAEIVNAGGFRTAGEALGYSGYRSVSLEQLIQVDAALISTNLNDGQPASMAHETLTHPLLRRMADKALARIEIPSRYFVCTTPETLDMVASLVAARKQVDAAKASGARTPTRP